MLSLSAVAADYKHAETDKAVTEEHRGKYDHQYQNDVEFAHSDLVGDGEGKVW